MPKKVDNMIASEHTTAQPSDVLGHGLAPVQLPSNIGLALSGGGFRATVYHLGVLTRLAQSTLLERVSFLSTVSGGSLAIGLILDGEKPQWPTSDAFLVSTLPRARKLLTGPSLQWALLREQLRRFWTILGPRADLLSGLIRSLWNVSAKVGALPERPLWYINATCVETAKNWRFERRRMGDYQFSYSADTDKVDLSDALAASAAYPGLIGRLKFPTQKYSWQAPRAPQPGEAADDPRQFIHKGVNLWDGGAYDNLGWRRCTSLAANGDRASILPLSATPPGAHRPNGIASISLR